jgi:hypothetical protein
MLHYQQKIFINEKGKNSCLMIKFILNQSYTRRCKQLYPDAARVILYIEFCLIDTVQWLLLQTLRKGHQIPCQMVFSPILTVDN